MDEELDGLGLGLHGDLELHLEGEVGGDALALPDAHVLLDDALQALDVQVGRLDDVVDAEGRRDAHAPADLGRVLGLLLGHVGGGGDVAGEGDLQARGAEAQGAGLKWSEAAARRGAGEAAEEEDGGGGGGGEDHGAGAGGDGDGAVVGGLHLRHLPRAQPEDGAHLRRPRRGGRPPRDLAAPDNEPAGAWRQRLLELMIPSILP